MPERNDQDKAQFGSIIQSYMKLLHDYGEDAVQDMAIDAHNKRMTEIGVTPTTNSAYYWEQFKKIVPEQIPMPDPDWKCGAYCQLPIQVQCTVQDDDSRISVTNLGMRETGHWFGDWWGVNYSIALSNGMWTIRATEPIETVHLKFEDNQVLKIKTDLALRAPDPSDMSWVTMSEYHCETHSPVNKPIQPQQYAKHWYEWDDIQNFALVHGQTWDRARCESFLDEHEDEIGNTMREAGDQCIEEEIEEIIDIEAEEENEDDG